MNTFATPLWSTPSLLRTLTLAAGQHPRGQPHWSAASGLVRLGQRLYVVADDEWHLGVFDNSTAPGTLLRLRDGDLPSDKDERKKAKSDLETLALLPALPGYPHGALLALGSGSTPQREKGVLLGLDAQGLPHGPPAWVDCAPLYAPLRQQFADLNIEGAFVQGDALVLLQRGNQGDARSACIRFDWHLVASWLVGLRSEPPLARSVQLLELGRVAGVPLGLTDGTALPDGGWAFSAVAESTANSYQDGACVGSALGVVSADGQLRQLHGLAGAPKVEGIAVQEQAGGCLFTLVTDPDDPASAAQVLQLWLPMAGSTVPAASALNAG